ncbi:MAG: signal peptidase II [Candidatus Dependentiae bacterium]
MKQSSIKQVSVKQASLKQSSVKQAPVKQLSIKKVLAYFLWFTSIFVIDRLAKFYALRTFVVPHDICELLQFKLVFNRGISWGMFHSENAFFFTFLTLLIVSIICVLIVFTYKCLQEQKAIFAQLAVLAGAISNVIDRIVYGGVIDFIHVHIGSWSWPIFNIADVAIVLGIGWILWEHYNES